MITIATEFRILGPLEVVDDGRPIPLRGGMQRGLLALLLVHARQPVPEAVLLEQLWGARPPASGVTALRVRVSQLRRSLGPIGERITTTSGGYGLDAADEEIDARSFERRYGEGREALAAGDAMRARATLRAALALWRGAPLPDIGDTTSALAEIARLDELRLAAVEELMDADLALGRHAEVAAELDALVTAHPLRERLRGQLMLALYRSGRQAEALETYRMGRAALVEELGIEPGKPLQALERAILRHDTALTLPTSPLHAAERRADERKLVTFLAVRLRDAPRDPERTRAALERVRAVLASEVEQAGGRIESAVGETLTATFGVPVSVDDHASRALGAALAVRSRADDPLGIGVDSGIAVVGGGQIVGAAASNAVRLSERAEQGTVLVGARTAAAARGSFDFGDLDAEGVARLLGPAARPRPHERAQLVGRRRELAALLDAYGRCEADGVSQLMTLVGDAGVGKSRLVRELAASLPRVLLVRCPSTRRGGAYLPLGDLLRAERGLRDRDDPDEIVRKLGADRILGLALGLDVAGDLHPLAVREQFEQAWLTFVDGVAGRGPLVIAVEDIHWAQDALLDFVARLVAETNAPLLVLATARPELFGARPAWGRGAQASTIWLEPLSRPDAATLLGLVRGGEVDPEQESAILDRTEGNPFFVEELAQIDGLEAQIPDSVQAVLAGRIDLLPGREKAALQAAAVVGRSFSQADVAALLEGDVPDFALLEARDFVRRLASDDDTTLFAFKHALTYEVAYGSLTAATRCRLHAAYGDWLEQSRGGRDHDAAVLAHHYAAAARPDDAALVWGELPDEHARLRARAVHWLRRAAELATRRYEVDDAVTLIERALALEPDRAARLAALRGLARAHALRHDGDRFLGALMEALPLSDDDETTAELYTDLVFETAMRTGMWRRRPDRALVDGWIEDALRLAAPGSATRARALVATCVWAPSESYDAAIEAEAIAEQLGDPELMSYAWDARSITLWVAEEYEAARDSQWRRFDLADQIRDPDHVADIYYAPITAAVWYGQVADARRLARRHDEIVSTLTPHHRIHGLAALTEVEELSGEWETILSFAPRVDETVIANRETPCMRSPRILLVSAYAALRLGDAVRARELETLADEFGYEGFGHTLTTPRLRLALERGELEVVERLLREPIPDRGWHRAWLLLSTYAARLDALGALGRQRELEQWRPAIPQGTYLEAFHLRALGRVRRDATLVEQAARCFDALGLTRFAAETREGAPLGAPS